MLVIWIHVLSVWHEAVLWQLSFTLHIHNENWTETICRTNILVLCFIVFILFVQMLIKRKEYFHNLPERKLVYWCTSKSTKPRNYVSSGEVKNSQKGGKEPGQGGIRDNYCLFQLEEQKKKKSGKSKNWSERIENIIIYWLSQEKSRN